MPDIKTKCSHKHFGNWTDNLANRKVYREVPPKVEYSLTEVGIEFIPFIQYLKEWGVKRIATEV